METQAMEQTREYSRFKYKPGNRNLSNNHIKYLKDVITKHGYLESCPIIVNENYEIIDGQHRFEACKQMGLPILYVVQKSVADDLLIDLNITQKKWTTADYVSYYAVEKANPNYIRLAKLMQDTKLDVVTILCLAFNRDIGGNFLTRVKKGELVLDGTNYHSAKVLYDNIKMLAETLRLKIASRMCRAICVINRQTSFSWSTMLDRASKYRVKAYQCSTQQEWLDMLVNLYNHQCRKLANKLIIKE